MSHEFALRNTSKPNLRACRNMFSSRLKKGEEIGNDTSDGVQR